MGHNLQRPIFGITTTDSISIFLVYTRDSISVLFVSRLGTRTRLVYSVQPNRVLYKIPYFSCGLRVIEKEMKKIQKRYDTIMIENA